jgi:hypothetical protein
VNAWDPSGHSKKSIRKKLYRLGEDHRGFISDAKALHSVQYAIKLTEKVLKKEIQYSSVANGIHVCMIQAIIFRETIFMGVDDVLADTAVSLGLRSDSSTGVGQIFAKTAITAHNSFTNNKIKLTKKNIRKMWGDLQHKQTNIFYVGLELKRIKEIEYNYRNVKLKKSQVVKIFARYNGSGSAAKKYGKETYEYYIQFKKLAGKK